MSSAEGLQGIEPYGQIFTPELVTQSTTTFTLPNLAKKGARFVRLTWVDLTNIIRCRVIPIRAFEKLLLSKRPGVGIAKAGFGLVGVACAPGFDSTGEYLYVPDLLSIRPCGYTDGHISIMGHFMEKLLEGRSSYQTALCPRTKLSNVVNDARAAGVAFLIGIETEFILLKSTDPVVPVHTAPWSTTAALKNGAPETQCLEEIVESLEAAGIEVLMYHAEAAPGQYEIVTAPLPPLEAADAVVHTRETIYATAAKYGLRATLAPRLFAESCGSAAHAHISVHRTAEAPTRTLPAHPDTNHSTTLTPLERSFLQALLMHLPSIAAVTLPTRPSYGRVQDGVWSGGTYASWGTENREALVRLSGPPGAHHFEVRSHDGTANPYLALAAILGAGMKGIQESVELSVQECVVPAASLSEEERRRRGVNRRMPLSLEEARGKMRESAVVKEIFGEEFVSKYLSVNESIVKFMEKWMTADSEAKAEHNLISTF
ncbi:glutamine synthetase/guanido kinase [Vararia minispora EC-137]|uniref:Glutamine synthetase/guanido kinase n=1 Tax=Vararia minispora EC-137 TaxID=1314806 RepID=A0ACB8QK35_9AGAM|nr:glutamine synthetase/guanido kinase [Vararia minispora EC-137]